jgi:hypothetical protein
MLFWGHGVQDYLTIEDGTNSLYWNVENNYQNIRVTS